MKKIPQIAACMIFTAAPIMAATDCFKVAATVKSMISNNPEQSLVIVEKQIVSAPGCACEIVKSAIQASHADVELVAQIVETAILAAPEHMRIIAQCAIAVAPDALSAVQGVLAKLDPNSGESHSSKSAKYSGKGGNEVAAEQDQTVMPSPLDFPGSGPVGLTGGLGGGSIIGGTSMFQAFFPGLPTVPVIPPLETPIQP